MHTQPMSTNDTKVKGFVTFIIKTVVLLFVAFDMFVSTKSVIHVLCLVSYIADKYRSMFLYFRCISLRMITSTIVFLDTYVFVLLCYSLGTVKPFSCTARSRCMPSTTGMYTFVVLPAKHSSK